MLLLKIGNSLSNVLAKICRCGALWDSLHSFLTTYVNIHVEIVCLKQQVSCCIPFYRISGPPSLSCPLAFLSRAMFALQCYHEAVCFLLVAQYFVVIAVLHANVWKRLFPPVKEGVGEQALLSNVVLDLTGCQRKFLQYLALLQYVLVFCNYFLNFQVSETRIICN